MYDRPMTIHPAGAVFLAQTAAEYGGLLNAIVAGFAAARDKVELFVGAGNTKYLLIAALVMFVLVFVRRRR
ncbi:MAG: hypothetical protein H6Q05_2808 [Acidobacteria bacterium]|nr:hypothetical protein [Acidobacteriota bacterium]